MTVATVGRRRCEENNQAHHQRETSGALIVNEEINRPRGLKMVYIRVYGTCTQSLLDTKAIPILILDNLAEEIYSTTEAIKHKINMADGKMRLSWV